MSRIGRLPVTVPAGVEVTIDGQDVHVKGPKGSLSHTVATPIAVDRSEDGTIAVTRPDDERRNRSLHGLTRTLIANMVEGVTNGYEKKLEIVGTGYRVVAKGSDLEFALGYSHPITVKAPEGISFTTDGPLRLSVQGIDNTDATVVSNDSFQEFHAEYEWLFEPGRLIGGKPVPGVGWIFSLRRPVRGIVSRKTTQRAKKDAKVEKEVRAAIAEATADAFHQPDRRPPPAAGGRGGKPTTETTEPEAVNQPAPFLQFVIDHRLGTSVDGPSTCSPRTARSSSSTACAATSRSARWAIRVRRGRAVLQRGETRTFVVQAVDAPRRGIELALRASRRSWACRATRPSRPR